MIAKKELNILIMMSCLVKYSWVVILTATEMVEVPKLAV